MADDGSFTSRTITQVPAIVVHVGIRQVGAPRIEVHGPACPYRVGCQDEGLSLALHLYRARALRQEKLPGLRVDHVQLGGIGARCLIAMMGLGALDHGPIAQVPAIRQREGGVQQVLLLLERVAEIVHHLFRTVLERREAAAHAEDPVQTVPITAHQPMQVLRVRGESEVVAR